MPRLRLPPDDRPRVLGAGGLGMSGDTQLFRGRVEDGFGYEVNATGTPALIPLLFNGAELRSLMRVYPERYRSPQSVSIASI